MNDDYDETFVAKPRALYYKGPLQSFGSTSSINTIELCTVNGTWVNEDGIEVLATLVLYEDNRLVGMYHVVA